MIKIYQRYLASNFISPFILSTLFFVTFLLTFQLFRVMRVVIGKDVDNWLLLELIGHIAISFLPMAIPISVLFAAIFTLNRLSEDSEIVALRSFGLPKWKLFAPFLVMACLISIMLFTFNRSLIPQSRAQFRNTLIVLSSQGMLTNVRPEQFYMEIPGVTLFADTVEEGGDHFGDVFIIFESGRDKIEQIITAKTGALIKQFGTSDQGDFASPSLRMHLRNGSITKTYGDRDDMEVIHFEEYDFPIVTEFLGPSTIARDSMRTNRELGQIIRERKDEIASLLSSPGQAEEVERLRGELSSTQIEYWTRFNVPLQCIAFVLMGFSLGIKQGRGKSRNSGALSILVVIAYYGVYFSSLGLTQRGFVHPSITAFLPSLLTLMVASYFYKKVDWAS